MILKEDLKHNGVMLNTNLKGVIELTFHRVPSLQFMTLARELHCDSDENEGAAWVVFEIAPNLKLVFFEDKEAI